MASTRSECVIVQRPLAPPPGLDWPRPWHFQNQVFAVRLSEPDESARPWQQILEFEPCPSVAPDPLRMAHLHKGYFDSHLHGVWMGSQARDIDLRTCASVEEFLIALRLALRQAGTRSF